MERMREVLNEFMRFMNPHLRLCSRLSRQQFIFSSESNTDLFSRNREEREKKKKNQHIRSSTKRDKFVAIRVNRFVIRGGKDHSLKSRG